MLYVQMLVDFFASPRHQKCVLYSLSLATYHRILVDLCQDIYKTSAVPSIFAQKQTQSCQRPPPNERPYQRQRKEGESVPEKGPFSVSSEPEILISKIPEAANSIPETGNNETIIEITNPGPSEMPSTEKDLNEVLKQLRLLRQKYADLKNKKFQIWKTKIKCFSQTSSR